MEDLKKLILILSIFLLVMSSLNIIFTITEAEFATGKSTAQVGTVSLTIVSGCYISLLEGWNLISLCANETDTRVVYVLNNTDYRYVMEWNETNQEFMIYSPRAETNPFVELNNTKSYFVYSNEPKTIFLTGDEFNDLYLDLEEGWNTPFYPYYFTGNITKYLNTLGSKYRYMMKWDASSQEFMIYSPRAETNTFHTIEVGKGQFINMYEQAQLFYNKTDLEN